MTLKLLIATHALHTSIAPRLRKRQLHRLIKQLEALHFINRLLRALCAVKDDECLALGFQVRLGYDVDDLAVLGEKLAERLLELLDLDALLEVADVEARGGLAGALGECGVRVRVQ